MFLQMFTIHYFSVADQSGNGEMLTISQIPKSVNKVYTVLSFFPPCAAHVVLNIICWVAKKKLHKIHYFDLIYFLWLSVIVFGEEKGGGGKRVVDRSCRKLGIFMLLGGRDWRHRNKPKEAIPEKTRPKLLIISGLVNPCLGAVSDVSVDWMKLCWCVRSRTVEPADPDWLSKGLLI